MKKILFLITFLFFATTAFATLPNEAVFNWAQYKFPRVFPKSQTVKSELTYEGVHYDLRSWSGAWGTRYLGITDDGEIVGLGDYTENELKSFGYIDDWADAVVADDDKVFSDTNVTTSVVYSETPNVSFDLSLGIVGGISSLYFTNDVAGNFHAYFWPSYYNKYPLLPMLEFTEITQDKFIVTREDPDVAMGVSRWATPMDTGDSTIKRFAIADQGLEISGVSNENFTFGDLWIATDYGNGFEFEKINTYKAFYHNVAAYDIDNNGYDDLVAVNMGVRGGEFEADSLHTFSQYNDGQFEQIDAFDRTGLSDNRFYQLGTAGSTTFADLDNDGDKELIQGAYVVGEWLEQNWGAIRIWELNEYGEYQEATTITREGSLFDVDGWDFGASGVYTIDYNKDGLLDILVHVEDNAGVDGSGVELYRNDGDYQFTRVTDSVLPVNRFGAEKFQSRELYIVDVNGDGLDDIIFNPMFSRTDFTNIDPNWTDQRFSEFYDDGLLNGFQYNIGAAIWLNTGSTFKNQQDNPTYTARIDHIEYPMFMRYMDTKNGVTRFFGFSEDGTPVVIKVQY